MSGYEENPKAAIVALLADGHYHSGQWLANQLGISRTAVWKRIAALENLGLSVERTRGEGYRLAGGCELLDEKVILAGVSERSRAQLAQLLVLDVVSSTNEIALRGLADATMAHGVVILAERQTQGRGRRGRSWVSPYGRNVYLSLIWHFDCGVAKLEGLSLVIGLAVIRALRSLGVAGAALKWPNDVMANDAKLGGILIELSGDINGPVSAVIGIGLNVQMLGSIAEQIDQEWTDLYSIAQRDVGRNRTASRVLDATIEILSEFTASSFRKFRDEWRPVDWLRGKDVTLTAAHEILEGRADGVDEAGALIINTMNGKRTIHGGEVTVRLRN